MNEQQQAASTLSSFPSHAFDRLLRRAALNTRLIRAVRAGGFEVSERAEFSAIGETAGALWQVLSEDGPMTLASLIEEVSVPESLFFMAVGWLAREEKVEMEPRGGDYEIRLR